MSIRDEADARQMLRDADPLRNVALPPMKLTAEEIRRQVDSGHARLPSRQVRFKLYLAQQRLRGRWRLRLAAATVVTAVVGVVAAVVIAPEAAMANTPALLDLPSTSRPAGDQLQQIAAQAAHGAAPPTSLPVTYVHLQTWSIDTTATDARTAAQVFAQDRQTWRAPDFSGLTWISDLPAQKPGSRRADYIDALPATSATRRERDGRGGLHVPIVDPSRDPATLEEQLAVDQPTANGQQFTVRAIANLYRYHALDARQRIAALTVLARTTDLRYRGHTTDRAGRVGLAFSIDSGTPEDGVIEDVLVIDPTTGALLSHEQVALTKAPRDITPAPAVISYTLYLANEKVTTTP